MLDPAVFSTIVRPNTFSEEASLRTIVPLLLVSFLVSGCVTTHQPANAPAPSNVQRIRSLYDAFGRGDVPTVLGSFDPNIVWMEAENANYADRNPYRGPQAVGEGIFMRIGQDWSNFRVNVEQLIDGGGNVVALGRYTGTNKSTGQPLNAQFVHVWSLQENRIVRFQQYTDTAQFARVTGVWK